MGLVEQINHDMVAAMKTRSTEKLSTLRMVKAALKNKEIEKRAPLTDPEAVQVFITMVKQRHESIEHFTRGNRPLLAEKEAAEIVVIESYMPKSASEDQIRSIVDEVVTEMSATGTRPTTKDMGSVMKVVQAKIQAAALRADGKLVSERVKASLA